MAGDVMTATTREQTVFQLIGLPPGGLLVTGIETRLWGKTHIVAFDYSGGENIEKQFKLIFENCHQLTWQMMNDEIDERDVNADVIGVDLYTKSEHQLTVIHTDLFELVFEHDTLTVVKHW